MTGVGFRTGLFFTGEIETEIFSALLAEFKKVSIQDLTTDLTVTNAIRQPYTLSFRCSPLIHWGRILKFRSGRYRNATHCVTDT
jgi:hypothetical protein